MRTYLAHALLEFRKLKGYEQVVWGDCLNFIGDQKRKLNTEVTDCNIVYANLKTDRYKEIHREMPIDDDFLILCAKAAIHFHQFIAKHARVSGLKSLCLLISTYEKLWGIRNDVYRFPWTDSISIYLLMLFDRLHVYNRYKVINTLGALESATGHSQIGHPTLNIIRSLFSRRIALLDRIQSQISPQDNISAVTINLFGSLLCCHARCTPLAQFCDKNIDSDEKIFLCALGMVCDIDGQFRVVCERLGQFAKYTNTTKKPSLPSNVEDIVRLCKNLVDAVEAIPTILDTDGSSLKTDIFPCIVDSAAQLREVALAAEHEFKMIYPPKQDK